MRTARMRVDDKGCYYHLTNRLCGRLDSYPITDVDKEKGFKMIEQLSSFYLL